MTQTPEQIAASLTKAQREALLRCVPWDVCVGAGIAVAFCANGLLEESTILDDGVQLSATGLAVRTILERNRNDAG